MATLMARAEEQMRLGGLGATHTEAAQTPDSHQGSPTTPGHTRHVNTLDNQEGQKYSLNIFKEYHYRSVYINK